MLEASNQNELIIIGGPNGSGKTTLAKELLEHYNYEYLSADEIAYKLKPDNPLSVRLEAGKKFYRQLHQLGRDRKNLLIESTLSGKSLLRIIKKFRNTLNYSISIIFIFLDNEQICIERVENRVRKGGHPVPEDDIIRRFGRSITNFWNEYRIICDTMDIVL